jgi:hypothetical protein
MSHTITVRLTPELAAWLEEASSKTVRPQGQIIRDELDRARGSANEKPFMRLAGKISGPKNLSRRKGFSRQ